MDNKEIDFDVVREKLKETVEKGLLLKKIAQYTGMGAHELSNFKNSKGCIKRSDAKILLSYLDRVVIPEHF